MLCSNCHSLTQPDFIFCPYCGKKIIAATAKKNWLRPLAGLAAFIILLIIWNFSASQSITDPIENHLSALRSNKITEAYYEYSSNGFQGEIPLAAFRELIKAYPALSLNKSIAFEEQLINDNLASLKAKLIAYDKTETPVEYNLIKEGNAWKIRNINIAAAPGAGSGSTATDWLYPIDTQLRDLRNRDIKSAYDNTVSRDFKAATTLEAFTRFIERYPIIFSYHDLAVKSQSIHEHEAEVTVILNPEQEAIPVQYRLNKEKGEWKIWSMNIVSAFSETVTDLLHDPKSLHAPIEGQIQAMKKNEVQKAYYEFGSKPFKDAISLDAFRKFIEKFPVLTTHDAVEFKEPIIDKTTGHVELNLYDKFGTTIVEYTLGIEDDKWKIWGIRVLEQNPGRTTGTIAKKPSDSNTMGILSGPKSTDNSSTSSLDFTKAEVGTGLNLKGNIVDPSNNLVNPHGDVYVNLYVQNGIARVKVDMHLEHVESHSTMPEVSTTLQQDGNSTLSFAFSPPPQGWPKGHYLIKAVSSTGISREFSFMIE